MAFADLLFYADDIMNNFFMQFIKVFVNPFLVLSYLKHFKGIGIRTCGYIVAMLGTFGNASKCVGSQNWPKNCILNPSPFQKMAEWAANWFCKNIYGIF